MRKVQFSPTLLSAAILTALSGSVYAQNEDTQNKISTDDVAVQLGSIDPTNPAFEKNSTQGILNVQGDNRTSLLLSSGEHVVDLLYISHTSDGEAQDGIVVTSGSLRADTTYEGDGTITVNRYGIVLGLSSKEEYPDLEDRLAKGAVVNLGNTENITQEPNKLKLYIGEHILINALDTGIKALKGGDGVINAIEIENNWSILGDKVAIDLSEFAKGLQGDFTTSTINKYELYSNDNVSFLGSDHNDTLSNEISQAGDEVAGEFRGDIIMNKGNDTFTYMDSYRTFKKLIGSEEGGSEADEINRLTLINLIETDNRAITGSSDSEGAVENVKVLGWEHLTLQNSKFNLTGDLKLNEHKKIGQFTIDENSKLATLAADKTMYYSITNKGIIDLTSSKDKNIENNLTIAGNYQGEAGSKLIVRTTWNNPDEQKSDTLIIKGTESGSTVVEVKNGILGDVTLANKDERKDGLKANAVVKVEGTATGQVFTGTAQTAGALEAQLYYDADKKVYYWVLDGQNPHNAAILPAAAPVSNGAAIYAQPVSSYVQTQYANRLMALDQLGRLHERVAEQKTDKGNHNTWARVRYSDTQIQGRERLGFESQRTLIQIGNDFDRTSNQNGQVINGLMLSFSRADNKFYDKYTFENGNFIDNPSKTQQYRGKVRSDMLGVQAYRTHYFANHSYVDLVGGVIGVRNRFAENAQYGYGVQASVEVGRAYPISQNWYIEPQLQLSAQWLKFRDFNENGKRIEAHSDKVVQGRAGVRFHNNQLYFKADVIHHFAKPKAVSQIGTDRISESYAATRFDIGFGVEKALNAASTFKLYGDVKYTRSIHSGNRVFSKQPAHHEYSGEIGVRYLW